MSLQKILLVLNEMILQKRNGSYFRIIGAGEFTDQSFFGKKENDSLSWFFFIFIV